MECRQCHQENQRDRHSSARSQEQERAQKRSNAFTAFLAQKRRENMPQHHTDGRRAGPSHAASRKPVRQPDRQIPFRRIQNESDDSGYAPRCTMDIRRADVPTALSAHILAGLPLHQQETDRDPAKQVRQ
jgi:hypothetical protein